MSNEKELASPADMEIFSFVKYLFGEFVDVHGLDTKQIESVGRWTFWAWVKDNRNKYFTYEGYPSDDLSDVLRLSPDGKEAIATALQNDFFAAQTLTLLWPMLVLACRPQHQHKVSFVFANISIAYEDERIAQFPMYLRQKETMQPFTDAIICTWIWQKFRQGFNELMNMGCDGLYVFAQPIADLPTAVLPPNPGVDVHMQEPPKSP